MHSTHPSVILKPKRERSVRNRHPWVFSGAVARVEGQAEDGDVVNVRDSVGAFLARGVINRSSQIVVRLFTFADEPVDDELWRRRIHEAVARRSHLVADPRTTAYRVVHAEADGLPGLVVDRYGDWLVLQLLSLAAERRRDLLVAALVELFEPHGVYNRSDEAVRRKEGLAPEAGPLWGAEPPEVLEIAEHGLSFLADVRRGHKTGFYLDQRENRRSVGQRCEGAEVLNVFSYSGGFAVTAVGGGARAVTNLDASAEALSLAEAAVARNALKPVPCHFLEGNAFHLLRRLRDQGRRFDVVVLDPPKFAPGRAQLEGALRGYKDINLLGLQLLRPGGLLATFSCSQAMSPDLLQRAVFQASADAGRDTRMIDVLGQPEDHPVLLSFPESFYLKGMICRVDSPA